MSQTPALAVGVVSLFDARPFFEKALLFGVAHGIIDQAKLDAIAQEAPRGMVQIARYFGNEFLRPELELARERIVNLVSLHLEDASGGDLRVAAGLLRDHSFLSRSKAGSDMLKALLVMPRDTHFMNKDVADDQLKKALGEWSLKSYSEYRTELFVRKPATMVVDAALWLAEQLRMSGDGLQNCERHAEAVIRTSLIALSEDIEILPDRVAFEKIIAGWRRKSQSTVTKRLNLPHDLPEEYRGVVEDIRQSMLADLPQILDKNRLAKALFRSLRFKERYFWIEDFHNEVHHHEDALSAKWYKDTQGTSNESTLLTMFLCVAAGRRTPKTELTEKSAATLIRKIRKSGFQPATAIDYIKANVPHQHQEDYLQLWASFVDEVKATLLNDHDYKLNDALALLRRECNIT